MRPNLISHHREDPVLRAISSTERTVASLLIHLVSILGLPRIHRVTVPNWGSGRAATTAAKAYAVTAACVKTAVSAPLTLAVSAASLAFTAALVVGALGVGALAIAGGLIGGVGGVAAAGVQKLRQRPADLRTNARVGAAVLGAAFAAPGVAALSLSWGLGVCGFLVAVKAANALVSAAARALGAGVALGVGLVAVPITAVIARRRSVFSAPSPSVELTGKVESFVPRDFGPSPTRTLQVPSAPAPASPQSVYQREGIS